MVEDGGSGGQFPGNSLDGLGRRLNSLNRRKKKIVLLLVDFVLFSLCLPLAYWLRLGDLFAWNQLSPETTSLVSLGGVLSLWLAGFYRNLIRAFDFRSVNTLLFGCLIVSTAFAVAGLVWDDVFVPRSVPVIYFLLSFILIGSSRVFARWLYNYSVMQRGNKHPVLILGAGDEGNQIAGVLSGSSEFSLVGFLEEDRTLVNSYMRGRRVFGIDQIDSILKRYQKLKIFVSFRDLTPKRKANIYQQLARSGVEIEVIPDLSEVVAGRLSLESAREPRLEDFLGRDAVQPIDKIFSEPIRGRVILVSGGGGSIGSELCRQLISNQVSRLIILEQSEFALYRIEATLRQNLQGASSDIEIIARLGSVDDRQLVRRLLAEVKPDFVFHAAAYKHVPIVEENVLEGVRNNILATEILASESVSAGVKRFTLVSTDKAVRPTNVMGATKRTAEMVVQAYAAEQTGTIFSMVRFGNVLGSSGSVIPLFMEQIRNAGPVTVTHQEITRYFMTIPEAAQLVIQASFLAKGGEVFVLDMGEPVRISDIARLAIQLSGFSVKDDDNPDGDIEIKYIGLRPGEKLYEELLIGGNASATDHPQIMKADENALPFDVMAGHLKTFQKSIIQGNAQCSVNLLEAIVTGFKKQ